MAYEFGNDKKSAFQAQYDAQKIAFAPIMFQAARALRDLGILETVKNHKQGITIEEVADKLNLPVYGVKVLLEAGLSIELVYAKDHKFFITKTGWFIMNDELTKVNMDFTHDVNYLGFFKLKEAVKSGKPEGLKVFGDWNTIYAALSELPDHVRKSWFGFDHYYSDDSFPQALPIIFNNNPHKILDVGGNTGKFAIKCAEYNPNVKITILDLPGQLADAYKNINDKGLNERIDGYPIDLLDHSLPYPQNYDVVWMSQFLDCFSQDDIVELLKKAKAALNPDGAIYIMETFWDNQRTDAGRYSLVATSLYFTCMANGCSQMYHTQDMIDLIEKAGLKLDETFEKIGVSHTIFKCVI
ncbi:MAG TPA: class I SAM-dependent methyltransferase [Bacteroidales bacterium]|nr:class I SAM-dependent methyltransferase [Bacteroidales bacterium]